MEPISHLTLTELVNRLALVESELRRREPLLMQERDLYLGAIKSYDTQEKPYAGARSHRTVLPKCLARNQAWMTRDQIQRDIEQGGFIIENPATFPALLADAIRYHTKKGTLVRIDADGNVIKPGSYAPRTRFSDERFGLPEWVGTRKIPYFRKN